jgi:murein DD-endopeptidase MepM/ murein hydrolase activator NlpD
MNRKTPRRGRIIPILFFTFAAGTAAGWWGRGVVNHPPGAPGSDIPLAVDRNGAGSVDATRDRTGSRETNAPVAAPSTIGPGAGAPSAVLAAKRLRLPIDDADVHALQGQFSDRRDGGARGHEAVDILAPRNTPVHAVDDGTIAKLFDSKQGGITVYQFDPSGRFCYYYAHLERYASGLHDGQSIGRGDILGYVGTSGNAPANTPHLHFAIFELTPERHWWQGTPLDPSLAFSQ